MRRATILHEAETELGESVAYYEERCPGLGLDLARDARAAFDTIESHPLRYALRKDGTRRLLLARFPFLVIYAIESDRIWILAFAHCKRQPGYWDQRRR